MRRLFWNVDFQDILYCLQNGVSLSEYSLADYIVNLKYMTVNSLTDTWIHEFISSECTLSSDFSVINEDSRRLVQASVWAPCLFSFMEPWTSEPSDLRGGGSREWVIQTYQEEKHEAKMHYCYYLWISAQFYVA